MRKQELHPRTQIINNKQQNQAKTARHSALAWLAARFPQAFDNSLSIRPLKLGIMADILAVADKAAEAGISKSKLREAVVLFTRRIDYLVCLKAQEMRVDLEGNPCHSVTDEEAAQASLKIKKRVERCAKNARKEQNSNPTNVGHAKWTPPIKQRPAEGSQLPEYPSAFNAQDFAIQTPRANPVIIKHKTTRTYDPDAVARMKEKLGLSVKQSN